MGPHAQRVARGLDLRSRGCHADGEGREVLGHAPADRHVAPRRRGRERIRARLDAVRNDRVLDAVQLFHAFDHDDLGPGARDLRAHPRQHARQVHDLGLARRVDEPRRAARERGREQHVLRPGDGDRVEHDLDALEPRRLRLDVAVVEPDVGAELLEAARCRSMGRTPMAHPPGSDTRTEPERASRGPSTSTEARMVLTKSYGASAEPIRRVSIVAVVPSDSTREPMCWRSLPSVRMSATLGRLVSRTGSSVRSAAARQGSAAFFAPEIATSPESRTGPSIRNLSTACGFY